MNSNFKKGILSALIESNRIMPQIILQFDDAKTGEKAALKLDHKKPEIHAEAAMLSITETLRNNRIGTLSDWVPMLWDKVAATCPEEIAKLGDDERMEALSEISKCDAQVNLSIDFAKKMPDEAELKAQGLKWIKNEGNTLISEAYKHAGISMKTALDGKPFFEPEIPDLEKKRNEGTFGIMTYLHDEFKDIPNTIGLSVRGYSAHGHEIYEETEHKRVDESRYATAFWKKTPEIMPKKRERIMNNIRYIASKLDEKSARKLNNLADKIEEECTLTNPSVSGNDWEKIMRKLWENLSSDYAATQIYEIFDKLSETEEAWKTMSNIVLKRHINDNKCLRQLEDQSLADFCRNRELMIHCFAKSWTLAKAENEKTEEISLESAYMTAEEAEAIAEEMGF